jgi:hypothetical protein
LNAFCGGKVRSYLLRVIGERGKKLLVFRVQFSGKRERSAE